MSKYLTITLAAVTLAVASFLLVVYPGSNQNPAPRSTPASSNVPSILPVTITSPLPIVMPSPFSNRSNHEIVASDLKIPWALAWLSDGTLLATERPGQLLKITPDHQVFPIDGVSPVGEGGLLGLAVHPHFSETHWLYLYLTTGSRFKLANRIERYRLVDNQLQERTIILEGIPGSQFHDGGRLKFGPDQKLYVTTGDAGNEADAQNPQSLAGKILRLNDDGSLPADNPFNNAVYSYGHRNSQGLAWDKAGRLWATEHGRSGALSGYDEINLIKPGQNYGWPLIQGDESRAGLISPLAHSGPQTTWAPASAAIINDTLYFGGLRGEAFYQVKLAGEKLAGPIAALYSGQYGRIREVTVSPDGLLYLTTSNTDGRGTPKEGDDKIIRLNPTNL